MKHHVAKPVPADMRQRLHDHPALRRLHRCKTPEEVSALAAGLNASQREEMLRGLVLLAWARMRRE